MNKIVITGPECCGKTTLARTLSSNYGGALVPEFARSYLSINSYEYDQDDLNRIAAGQIALEDAAVGLDKTFVFYDTGFYVLKIWSKLKFGSDNGHVEALFADHHYDHYILCTPDIEWVPDGLRENPDDRWSIFYLYHKALIDNAESFVIVEGSIENRLRQVSEFLEVA